ncbi:transporter substrate-binding domain-containing protein [Beggiatoa leptomitoformis]|uniref:Transporter substrate-binding domain-containing protein n=1 Tax=Beggiatoa leptomitoformis TaxID=288004 RepID=A0A2N9YC66_9GAMM|nr:transporter substrate-binding domain-containing protein [Beggiatoa leptomitoformis]ALG69271.2 transporter substrate-binding domain-containing protein [Beggiatoa leptomitoformis]AUI68058.1 transporter substrate-binding domain-containing protein [Beggiatoa leptomitoformis]
MKTIYKIIIVLLIIIGGVGLYQTFISVPPAPVVREHLVVVTEASYPPFNMRNEKGEIVGFDIDLINTLCDRVKIKCTMTTQNWDKIVSGLLTKQYDVIVNSMSITADRQLFLAFSDPYQSNRLAFIVPVASNIHYNKELKGKIIAVQKGTVSTRYLEAAANFGVLQVKQFETQNDAWNSLLNKEVDAVLTDKLLGYAWLKTAQAKDYAFTDEFIDFGDKIGIAFRKEDSALVKQFNAALADILRDGTYEKMNANYFPFSIY